MSIPKLSETEVHTSISSISTEDDVVRIIRGFTEQHPEFAGYIDSAANAYNATERYFLITAAATIWHVIRAHGGDLSPVTQSHISSTMGSLNEEIKPAVAGYENNPAGSMNAIIQLSSQPNLFLTLIGVLLKGSEDTNDGGDRLREENLQPLFYHLFSIIEILSRATNCKGDSDHAK